MLVTVSVKTVILWRLLVACASSLTKKEAVLGKKGTS